MSMCSYIVFTYAGQPQQEEPVSLLPKPSPASEVDAVMENNKEDEDKDKEEEEVGLCG